MKKLFLLMLIVVGFVLMPLFALSAEERVINLPNDQAKWYVSVVGEKGEASYLRILNWFSVNDNLAKLKEQVHFCQVTAGSPMYQERYMKNQGEYAIQHFPCVRVQKANGVVVYQTFGKNVPRSAESLYSAISVAITKTEACPLRRPCPKPEPNPEPDPLPEPDPVPGPIDDGGPPVIDEPVDTFPSTALVVGLMLAGLVVGAGAGVVRKFKDEYAGR